ncbi:MAG: ROK family transcriptional regulator [Caulobacterales bacterium]|nr:ROK family transcriptional regulator [Caulobacterales bacterium]
MTIQSRFAQNGATSTDAPALTSNERKVLKLVQQRGAITQVDVTRRTGLPQQSTSRIINRLIDRGALQQGARVSGGRRGQPSAELRLVPDYAFTIGVSIMVDAISVVMMNFTGEVLGRVDEPLPEMSLETVDRRLHAIVRKLSKKHLPEPARLFGMGVGISGYFLADSRMNTPLMLDEWAMIDIRNVLAEGFDLPVWVENDGGAAAIGESMVGVGRWASNFVYLYIATGLGGGVVINGELFRGTHGNAGELAEILPPRFFPHPNLEFLRQHVARHGVDVGSVAEMLARFDPTWRGVDEWILKTRDSLSLIASAGAAILDTEVIVIGGLIPRALAERVAPQIEVYRQHRRSAPRPVPEVVVAEAPSDAVAIGAAALPFKAHFFND